MLGLFCMSTLPLFSFPLLNVHSKLCTTTFLGTTNLWPLLNGGHCSQVSLGSKDSFWDLKMMVAIWRWSLAQVWLYSKASLVWKFTSFEMLQLWSSKKYFTILKLMIFFHFRDCVMRVSLGFPQSLDVCKFIPNLWILEGKEMVEITRLKLQSTKYQSLKLHS